MTEQSDETFSVWQFFLLTENEAPQDALLSIESIEVRPLVPKGIFRFRFSENSFVIFELSIEHKSQTNNYSR